MELQGLPTPALPMSQGDMKQTRCDPDTPRPCGTCVGGNRDPEDGSASASLDLGVQRQLAAPGAAVVTGNNVSSVLWCSCRGGRKAAAGSSSRGLPCQQLPARPRQWPGWGLGSPRLLGLQRGLGVGQPPPVLVGAHGISASEPRAPHTLTPSILTTGGEVGLVLSCR